MIRQIHTFKKSTTQIQIHMADRSVGEMIKNVGFGKFQEIAKKEQKLEFRLSIRLVFFVMDFITSLSRSLLEFESLCV